MQLLYTTWCSRQPRLLCLWTCGWHSKLAMTATRWTCRSKWTTVVCRSYSTAMAQQPKQTPSSKQKLKRSPLQRKESTTDPDSIEESSRHCIRCGECPRFICTTTDFWGSPMASFCLCICTGCRVTLIQQAANAQIPYDCKHAGLPEPGLISIYTVCGIE